MVALALSAAGCSGRDPTGALAPSSPTPGVLGGAGGGGNASGAIVGSWQLVTVLRLPADVQTTTVTWRFDANGICSRAIQTLSLVEGVPRVTVRACREELSGSDLLITFEGDSAANRFSVAFAGFSPDRLLLDGFEYHRIG